MSRLVLWRCLDVIKLEIGCALHLQSAKVTCPHGAHTGEGGSLEGY